ncbi:hypothetical protein KAR91_79540 [Candidatus Pacearchaeota archaeon]|nr:hypothetical protein [Candidatus Pacearchaeota archaeon]
MPKKKKLCSKTCPLKLFKQPWLWMIIGIMAIVPFLRYGQQLEQAEVVHRAAQEAPVSTTVCPSDALTSSWGKVVVNMPVPNARYHLVRKGEDGGIIKNLVGTRAYNLRPGSYEVRFEPLFGYHVSGPKSLVLQADQTIVVEGEYKVDTNSPSLRVLVQPKMAMYRIHNADGQALLQQQGGQMFALPAGRYKIEFGPISGLTPPKMMDFEMISRTTTTVTAEYEAEK